MSKKHISDSHLEEFVANFLIDRAKVKKSREEDFSFNTILNEAQKEYNVDSDRLKEILSELTKKEIISVKSRQFNVYLPKDSEKKFSSLKDDNAVALLTSAFMIGYFLFFFIISYLGIQIVLKPWNSNDFLFFLILGFLGPLILGTIVITVMRRIYNVLYKNTGWFKEMIDFFGGPKVWKYAFILGIVPTIIYLIISMLIINPYFLITIFFGPFLSILGIGATRRRATERERVEQ